MVHRMWKARMERVVSMGYEVQMEGLYLTMHAELSLSLLLLHLLPNALHNWRFRALGCVLPLHGLQRVPSLMSAGY